MRVDVKAYLDGGVPIYEAKDAGRGVPGELLTEAECVEAALWIAYAGNPPEGYEGPNDTMRWRGDATKRMPEVLILASRATRWAAQSLLESTTEPKFESWHQKAASFIVHPFAALRQARVLQVLHDELLEESEHYLDLANYAVRYERELFSKPKGDTE